MSYYTVTAVHQDSEIGYGEGESDAYAIQDCISTADDEPSFALDAVTRLHANCYIVRFYFTNHALTPQQHALDLN